MESLVETMAQTKAATTWREYETKDNQFHQLISEAAESKPLLAMFNELYGLRRTAVWGPKGRNTPEPERHSFAEHDTIVPAIKIRDGNAVHEAMKVHLLHVTKCMFHERI